MKYLKTFGDFGLNKDWVFSPLDDDELKDVYEYFLSVNANPKIYKYISSTIANEVGKILYTDNEDLKHRFLIGRSIRPENLPFKIIPDPEKEKEIQTQLASKKYNL